jgi:hypothetical protein
VHKQQLGRAVVQVIFALLLADAAEIPDVNAAVGSGGSEDGFVVRRPG